ncbi:Multiple ankyrin repeats single kh domain [Mycena sanguinolenta]|uniref:Multiple ankyrin repeats single kh domain n=1 Tax=Mycena sanguinolenta TaxID=230812 RepID=A0A8H7D2Y0_9AGAR|nr:Multiple ankyrin repeats single kh domain [Mycena sanguinolenta]
MDDNCIPANPDISGIGVRAAIYTQNLFCFVPVIAHLWDGNVSAAEIKGVMDQSIGMLAVAFAILISTIVEATSTNIVGGQGLTRFHAAIILDLSWMNNTSTWIWFLLYVHQCTKPGIESTQHPIRASWSAWTSVLLSPVRFLAGDGKKTQWTRVSSARRVWVFATKKPVLTIGSLHLSLMGAIGLWLWSNPSKFGSPIGECNPSFSVLGGPVPFSSPGLRIFSLAIYCLLIVPGLSLVFPFLFFLALHITYNKSRPQLEPFLHLLRAMPSTSSGLYRRSHNKNHDPESGIQLEETPGPIPAQTSSTARMDRTGFLIVGLVCLLIINVILLVDIELTLRRNKHHQSIGENDWGFGQVLALLLLVVPIRDFVTSVLEIRGIVGRNKKFMEDIQRTFLNHLREAIVNNTFAGHNFQDLIEQGASPNVNDLKPFWSLHHPWAILALFYFSSTKEWRTLRAGRAFYAAARNGHYRIAERLGKNLGEEYWRAHMGPVLAGLEKSLQVTNSDWESQRAALQWVSEVSVPEKFWEEFRSIVPMVVQLLSQHHPAVCPAALMCLGSLGTHRELQPEIRPAIPVVLKLLKHGSSSIREASIHCMSGIGPELEFQPDIGQAMSIVAELLTDVNSGVRRASIQCLSRLAAHKELQPDIRPVIPIVGELLRHGNSDVRQGSLECLSSLGAHTQLQPDIRPVIPMVRGLLNDGNSWIRQASIECLSSLGPQKEFQPDIRSAIPMVAELLKDDYPNFCRAAIDCLSNLGAHRELQPVIRTAISMKTKLLQDSNSDVREAARRFVSVVERMDPQAQ